MDQNFYEEELPEQFFLLNNIDEKLFRLGGILINMIIHCVNPSLNFPLNDVQWTYLI